MKVSIIIPTYNEESVIDDCINSLLVQSFRDFEIVIVDDGSSDGTLKLLSALKKDFKDLKLFSTDHKGAGSARNFGVSKSTGEILVFIDSDMTFDKNFLSNLINPIIKGQTKGTWSKEEYVSNWDNVWSRCWSINQGWEDKKRHPKNYPNIQPVFRALLRSEFLRVEGFEPGGYNDDWSLSTKLGYQATNSPDAIFYHKNPSTLEEVFKHSKWVGKRRYKLGILGFIIALVRSSLPISLLIGLYKTIVKREIGFLIFKIVYDFGISIGIISFLINNKGSK